MGRRRIHDGSVAAALVDAAERIVERDGLEGLTVRAVAAETGTTTRAVYSTVGSMAALLGRLGGRAFDLLGARVAGLPVTDDPVVDLVTAGTQGFRRFALDHPALFRVGIQQIAVPWEAVASILPVAQQALEPLLVRMHRLESASGLGARSVPDATWEFHALCEGMAAVELRGIIPAAGAERLWTDALTALVTGWHVDPPAGGRFAAAAGDPYR